MGLAPRWQTTLFLLPALVLVTVFLLIPLGAIVVMSLFQWPGVGPATFVGLDNFPALLADRAFARSFWNTIDWLAVGVLVHIPLCVLVALVLRHRPRGWRLFRTVFFIPNVISATALAMLWYFMFDPRLGLINDVLTRVGLGDLARAWLFDPATALRASQTPWVLYVGFGMVLFLTQIASIPNDLYEAAALDGATDWAADRHVTLPLIRPAIAVQLLLVVGYVLRMFEYPFVMTSGGPANMTSTLPLYMYRQMVVANAYGLSMATGVVTVGLGVVLVAGAFLLLRRWRP